MIKQHNSNQDRIRRMYHNTIVRDLKIVVAHRKRFLQLSESDHYERHFKYKNEGFNPLPTNDAYKCHELP